MPDDAAPPQPVRAPIVRLDRVEGRCDVPPANKEALLIAARRQLDWETCAYFAGIDYDYLLWLTHQADKHPTGQAAAFLADLVRATADGKVLLVSALYDSPDPRWKAWLLERKYPTEYGSRLQLSGPVEAKLSEFERRLKAISEATADDDSVPPVG